VIPFNRPAITGAERTNIDAVFTRGKFSGIGPFGQHCTSWLREYFGAPGALLTTSGTHALELAALLCDLAPGDEVILPSFTFSSTATAFARCGASLVFVDVDPRTMNMDPVAVAAAVTPRTKVLVVMHYGGVPCDMDALATIVHRHDLLVVEDAAHAIFSEYDGTLCGRLGHFGCFSFHETKNVHCGEGGALLINDVKFLERAEIILEKGTDRTRFQRGEVDRYTWQDIGSSYVLGELNAAFLLAQLEAGAEITSNRLDSWNEYQELLSPLAREGAIELADNRDIRHNAHLFWIKARDNAERTDLLRFLRVCDIQATFHYVPLHSSPAGRRYGRLAGADVHTSAEADRLLRLPIFFGFTEADRVAAAVHDFYRAR
jgi:dTDP-4-amino-4,6-dideoxygalactose transaminase